MCNSIVSVPKHCVFIYVDVILYISIFVYAEEIKTYKHALLS